MNSALAVAGLVVPGVVALVVLLAVAGLVAALLRHRRSGSHGRPVGPVRGGRPIGPPDPWTELGNVPVPVQRRHPPDSGVPARRRRPPETAAPVRRRRATR